MLAQPPHGAAWIAHRLKADAVLCRYDRRHRVLLCNVVWLGGRRCAAVAEFTDGRLLVRRVRCPGQVLAKMRGDSRFPKA